VAIGDFSIFQDGGRDHLEFLNFGTFAGRYEQEGSNCVIVPNFVTIGPTVPKIWRVFDFSKMAAVRHLGLVICDARAWITHDGHLAVFIAVQTLVVIDTVCSIICKF